MEASLMNNLSSPGFEINTMNVIMNHSQTINYHNMDVNDGNMNAAVTVNSDNVTIIPSSGKHSLGSSKVKLKNIIKYSWEYKFYPGQILAIHFSGTYIAYGIKSKDSGIIRVRNLKTSECALIKGINGMTQDVAFSFAFAPVLLACVDSVGDVYVYKVEENQLDTLTCTLMLHIEHDSTEMMEGFCRISWCPYVPDDDENDEDDPAKLIVTQGSKAYIWNVHEVRAKYGLNPVSPHSSIDDFTAIEVDNYTIVDVAFSPDGSTVALACSDGGIRFFQAETTGHHPTCIHDWRPHDGKPVSCLFFLDNHLDPDCHFWKFAVTGVEGNTELKIWTCETWSCLQTIKYAPIDASTTELQLKVAVDITANYLLLSDMTRKLLHVFQLEKNQEETIVQVQIISEFLMPAPILSFGIVKAKQGYFTDDALLSFESSVTVFNDDEVTVVDTDDRSNIQKTMIKLYLVQPKALHECIIVYDALEALNASGSENESKLMANNKYEDVMEAKLLNGLKESNDVKLLTPNDLTSIPSAPILMPNDKFITVSAIEERTVIQARALEEFLTDPKMNNDVNRRSVERDLPMHVDNVIPNGNEDEDTEEECNEDDRNEDAAGAIVSTGSSPSREVQNILYSSEVDDESCTSLPVKANVGDLLSGWPPIPEPENSCTNISDILRINTADAKRIRIEKGSEPKSFADFAKNKARLGAMNKKLEIMEARFTQLFDMMKNQQQEMKQSFSVLNRSLLANKDDDKKKQKFSNLEDKLFQDRLINSISQNVNSVLSNEVEFLIKQELSTKMLPSLKNTMDTLGQHLQMNMSAYMNTADQSLKEYIVKTVHKKSVSDALAASLAGMLPTIISNSFTEVFCNTILPKFEKSCHEMFDQVNTLFIEGTRDFVSALQAHSRSYEEKQCSTLQNKMDEFVFRLNEVTESSSISAIKSLEPNLVNVIKVSLEDQKKYLESFIMSLTKASSVNIAQESPKTMELAEYLISQGKFGEAIEHVLSASDLKLLVILCEKLDPDKLFEPCTIEQHVLLSFIQQLSVDFHIHTDLKHKYIEGAVLNLDKRHPICEMNIRRILPTVRTRISQYITLNPNNKNARNMKMLLMAVDSLLSDSNDV